MEMSVRTSSQSLEPGLLMVSTENSVPVSQAASADAIFIGCCSYMSFACMSPVTASRRNAMTPTTAPIRREEYQTR